MAKRLVDEVAPQRRLGLGNAHPLDLDPAEETDAEIAVAEVLDAQEPVHQQRAARGEISGERVGEPAVAARVLPVCAGAAGQEDRARVDRAVAVDDRVTLQDRRKKIVVPARSALETVDALSTIECVLFIAPDELVRTCASLEIVFPSRSIEKVISCSTEQRIASRESGD